MSNADGRVTAIWGRRLSGGKGVAREGMNIRVVWTMTSGYRLILIMESVQVKRSIFPPAHVPASPSPSTALFSLHPRNFNFAPSLYPLSSSLLFPLLIFPSGWSLFNIDFLSKGRKYRESIELRMPHSRLSSPVVCSALCGGRWRAGGERCANVYAEYSPSRTVLFV